MKRELLCVGRESLRRRLESHREWQMCHVRKPEDRRVSELRRLVDRADTVFVDLEPGSPLEAALAGLRRGAPEDWSSPGQGLLQLLANRPRLRVAVVYEWRAEDGMRPPDLTRARNELGWRTFEWDDLRQAVHLIDERIESPEDDWRSIHSALAEALTRESGHAGSLDTEEFHLSRSPMMLDFYRKLMLCAAGDEHVLLQGEIGSGKDVHARLIHLLSPRRNKPFEVYLFETTNRQTQRTSLLGVESGRSYDVTCDQGAIDLARGGTLFLNELQCCELDLQQSLNQLIERGSYRRSAGAGARPLACRLIFATNQDLEAASRQGLFRRDLLSKIRHTCAWLRLPPLRERPEDIPGLLDRLAAQLARQRSLMAVRVTDGLRERLSQLCATSSWSIRDLKNVLKETLEAALRQGGTGTGEPPELLTDHLACALAEWDTSHLALEAAPATPDEVGPTLAAVYAELSVLRRRLARLEARLDTGTEQPVATCLEPPAGDLRARVAKEVERALVETEEMRAPVGASLHVTLHRRSLPRDEIRRILVELRGQQLGAQLIAEKLGLPLTNCYELLKALGLRPSDEGADTDGEPAPRFKLTRGQPIWRVYRAILACVDTLPDEATAAELMGLSVPTLRRYRQKLGLPPIRGNPPR